MIPAAGDGTNRPLAGPVAAVLFLPAPHCLGFDAARLSSGLVGGTRVESRRADKPRRVGSGVDPLVSPADTGVVCGFCVSDGWFGRDSRGLLAVASPTPPRSLRGAERRLRARASSSLAAPQNQGI